MLSIIIVNYNSANLIIDSLNSLFRYNTKSLFEIIIVDNKPGADDKDRVLSLFPHVQWIQMDYNAGFARANNAGITRARGEAVLLLNPDTLALDNSIELCYESLMRSNFVAAGVQLLNVDNTNQISGSFFVKGGLNHVLPIPYWGDFVRWIGYKMHSRIPGLLESKAVEEIDWINGAFLMVKKNAIEKAGMLDEDFFLYAEEIEWCSRLKKIGPLCLFGNLRMIHLQGETINKDQKTMDKGYYDLYTRKGLQLMVSHHLRIRKQYGVAWFLLLLLNYTWGVFVFGISSFLHRIFTGRNPFSDWPKVTSFAKNVFNLWKLSPIIIRNKPHFYKMF